MFWCVSFLNPVASTVTEYLPGCRSGNVKLPLSLVVAWCDKAVAASTAVTLACGTAAPVVSFTVPSRVPFTAWPNSAMHELSNSTAITPKNLRPDFIAASKYCGLQNLVLLRPAEKYAH